MGPQTTADTLGIQTNDQRASGIMCPQRVEGRVENLVSVLDSYPTNPCMCINSTSLPNTRWHMDIKGDEGWIVNMAKFIPKWLILIL